MIRIRRVYEPPLPEDGKRFLVDRLWPRGLRKDALQLDGWLKDAAPSNEIRKTFHHDPQRWDDFIQAYFAELAASPKAWRPLVEAARAGSLTLLFAAKDETCNNAAALRQYLEAEISKPGE